MFGIFPSIKEKQNPKAQGSIPHVAFVQDTSSIRISPPMLLNYEADKIYVHRDVLNASTTKILKTGDLCKRPI